MPYLIRTFSYAALGAKFIWLLIDGRVFFYVNPRLIWVLAAGWALIAATTFLHGLFAAPGHNHGRQKKYVIIETAFLLALIFLPVRALTNDKPMTNAQPNAIAAQGTSLPENTLTYSYGDWYAAFVTGVPDAEWIGKPVSIMGTLSYDQSRNAFIGRHVITCCAADAFRHQFAVRVPDVLDHGIIEGEWYEIRGEWDYEKNQGWRVNVNGITHVVEPKQPYVYP